MKNKQIDDIIRQKLSQIDYHADIGEVEKVHSFVRSNQYWWQKYYWTKTSTYILAASVLIASLSYNLVQFQANEGLKSQMRQIVVDQPPIEQNSNQATDVSSPSTTEQTKTGENHSFRKLNEVPLVVEERPVAENKAQKLPKNLISRSQSESNLDVENSTLDKKINLKKFGGNGAANKGQQEFAKKEGFNDLPPMIATEASATTPKTIAEGGSIADVAAVDQSIIQRVVALDELATGKANFLKIPSRKIEALYDFIPLPRKIIPVPQHNFDFRVGMQLVGASFSRTAGVRGELLWKNKWSIATGLQLRTTKVNRFDDENQFKKDRGKEFDKEYPNHPPAPQGSRLRDIRLTQSFVEVPVNLGYYLHLKRGHSLLATLGTKIVLRERNAVDFRFQPVPNQPKDVVMKANRINQTFVLNNLNIGIGYQFSYKHLVLQVAPQIDLLNFSQRVKGPSADLGLRASALYSF